MARKTRGRPGPRRGGARGRAGAWARRAGSWWRAARGRARRWRPEVAVDRPGRRGRLLRRAVERAAAGHLRALGVEPPGRLVVVVQRTVCGGGRPLEALLQRWEDGAGERRHVLFLALEAGGRSVADGELVATLRQQLAGVCSHQLGELRLEVAQEPASAAAGRHEPAAAGPRALPPPAADPGPWAPARANGAAGPLADLLER